MLTFLVSFAALAAASTLSQPGSTIVLALRTIPETPSDAYIRKKCSCPEAIERDVIMLDGLVVDAELTLGPDGRSANDRQATIFEISPRNPHGVSGRTRVYHSSDTNKCGVIFDYGKWYHLFVRKTDAGEFETDKCLMRSIPPLE